MEIPKDSLTWLSKYRAGEIENQYGEFFCPEPGCVCEFVTLLDLVLHYDFGKHGRIGDRAAEENRRKFKYFSRQGRLKHDLYKAHAEETTQETLK